MKNLKYVGISFYVLFVLIITFCLFGKTPFSSSRFGDLSIVPLNADLGKFKKGSLLFGNSKLINKNDDIVYYNTINGKNVLSITKVNKIMNSSDVTYVINDGLFLSSEYAVGSVSKINSVFFLGYLYSFFTNSIVYFLTVIIPLLAYFIYLFRMRKYA